VQAPPSSALMDCEGAAWDSSQAQVSKSPAERSAGREHRVFVVPPAVEQSDPPQHKRLVDWSTVASPNVPSPEVPGMFKLKDSNSEVLSNVQGVGEGVTLILSRRDKASEEDDPFHMDDATPEQPNPSDIAREPSQEESNVEEADSETAAGAGDHAESGFPSLPFPLPTGPTKGKLESICEEEESTPVGAESDLGTLSRVLDLGTPTSDLGGRVEERKRRWSTGDVSADLSSPDGGLSRVRRSLEDVRLVLSPAGTSPRPEEAKDPRSYFSNRVWQKLEHLEGRVNKLEIKFFESIDLMQIHVEEQLAERRSQEERARKEFTEFFVAALDSQQKAFSGGLTELQVVHGTIPRDASTGGTANPPPTVMCPVDPANVLGVAQDYAAHAAELLNAHLPAEIIEKHTKIHSELEEKLKALHGIGSSPDSWDTKFDEMSPSMSQLLQNCGQCGTITMQPSQESVSPLRPSNGDESDFGKACIFNEIKYGPIPTEWCPEERKKVMREDSEAGHAGEEDIACEGAIFTLRSPLPTALHSGSYVAPPQQPQPISGAAITL